MKVRRRFLSTRDVMEILGISKSTAIRLMHSFAETGQLFRRGRLLRIDEDTFNEWLNNHMNSGQKIKTGGKHHG